jgi:hypothetical protein
MNFLIAVLSVIIASTVLPQIFLYGNADLNRMVKQRNTQLVAFWSIRTASRLISDQIGVCLIEER